MVGWQLACNSGESLPLTIWDALRVVGNSVHGPLSSGCWRRLNFIKGWLDLIKACMDITLMDWALPLRLDLLVMTSHDWDLVIHIIGPVQFNIYCDGD